MLFDLIDSHTLFALRRTDAQFEQDSTDLHLSADTFQWKEQIPLPLAICSAASEPGVYVLRLHGQVMKCGRACYNDNNGGIAWRLRQYYNLSYDNRARLGDHWSVNKQNRDQVTVSWQCCPISKCRELEYKLFQKYGKGPWTQRAPLPCEKDSWRLLI